MSLDVLTAIWRAPPCKGGDLLCLLAIADNADERGFAWPSIKTIATKAAMSERGAQKCLAKLSDAGLLSVEIGGGRGKSNAYQITTNGISEHLKHNNPEQSSPNRVHPLETINPEQSDINPEQNDAKPRTPVHPNRKGTAKEPCVSAKASPHTDFDFDDLVKQFLSQHPRPGNEDDTHIEFKKLVDAGIEPTALVNAAKSYADEQDGNRSQYVSLSENWLANGKYKKYLRSETVQATQQEIDQMHVSWIKGGKPYLIAQITDHRARELYGKGLIAEVDLQTAGFKTQLNTAE